MCIHKINDCKKRYQKIKIVQKIRKVYYTTTLFGPLVLASRCYCGDNGHKIGTPFKKLIVTINSYKKCLPVISWNKKHSSKQVVPVTCTLEKHFLQLRSLKVCVCFFFRQSKKSALYFGLYVSSLHF